MRIEVSGGAWEFWPDQEEAGEAIGLFLPGGGTGVEPYWAKGWPGYEQTPARQPVWESIAVPGHWQAQGHAGYQGPAWYRHRFTPPAEDEGRPFLEFGGVDFYADVWLNGDYLGFHEGDFAPFAFDVAGVLKPGEENLLVVRVSAPVDDRPEQKAMPKGGTYHWDALPVRQAPAPGMPEVPSAANPQYPNPVENPAGIWRPVVLAYRPALFVSSLRVTPVLKDGYTEADLFVTVDLENYTDQPVSGPLRVLLATHNFQGRGVRHPVIVHAPPGRSSHTFTVPVKEPSLWWSWDLGFPHLYKVMILVGSEPVPQVEVLVGFREFAKGDNWELYLNGRRFFARGTNYLSDRFLSLMTPERYAEDVRLMREANMNMVRVFAHLEQEEFYRLCNEQGMLLWQDLPFQWGYRPDGLFIQRAAAVARAAVEQVYNHPAVVMLCAHSESRIHDFNKLDEVLLRTIASLDRTRPVIKSSVLVDRGAAPRRWETLAEQAGYTREHLSVHWAGWYWGRLEDIEAYAPLFLSEFGTQSLPAVESLARFLPEGQLWPPDWEAWRQRGFQQNIYEKNLGEVPGALEELVARTQAYQSRYYRVTIEALRRKKYRPVNGLLQFLFADNWPAITWSILDYYRVAKPAYQAVKEAFNPLLLTFTFHPDEGHAAAWVVNDYPKAFAGLRLLYRYDGGALQVVGLPEVAEDEASVYARLPLPAGAGTLEAALVNGKGEVLSQWEGEVVPYQVPAEVECPSIV